MKSRIILSQADFSQNNIGRYVELSALTKKVLAKQTQYSESSEEAMALEVFIRNLQDGGFIGGENPLLTNLFIPGLAADRTQLLYDIAQLDGEGYPTNKMNQTEVSAAKPVFKTYEKNNKNIGLLRFTGMDYVRADADNQATVSMNIFTETGLYPAFSICSYLLDNNSNNNTICTNRPSEGKFTLAKTIAQISYGNDNVINTQMSNITLGFIGASYVVNTDFEILLASGTKGTTTIGDTTKAIISNLNTTNNFILGPFLYDGAAFGFFAFGKGLSAAKLTELKGYVDTLMTELHV